VSETDGAMLVIAGAGSGKTRVLTYRAAYLIHEKKVPPESIMAITFTNKAAEEMRERIIDLIGKRRYHPWVGTFHRTCANILRNYGPAVGLSDRFTVFDDSEQLAVIKRVMKNNNIDPKPYNPRSFLHRISRAKSHLITPEEFEESANDDFSKKILTVYTQYQMALREQNAFDFDDLLFEACLLLDNHRPTREILQAQYEHLLVDEFQDINPAQYRFIQLIVNPEHKNVFVVGDDDQAIYGWRYADPKFIDKFLDDFKPVNVIKLEDNYRSTDPILKVANEIIRQKTWGIEKTLRTNISGEDPPEFYFRQSEVDEAYFVAETIKEYIDEGGDYGDVVVLYRMNAQSRSFEEVFGRLGLPFQIIGGLRFYQRMEIKDILSYFRILVNDRDRPSLERAINTPKRGIGDKSKDKIFEFMVKNEFGLFDLVENKDDLIEKGLAPSIAKRLPPFLELMGRFRDKSRKLEHVKLLEWIIDKIEYEELLKAEGTYEADARLDNLNELKGAFKSFQEEYPGEGIDRFLEQVSLVSDLDSYQEKTSKITMMTLHSAKGLEFNVVFLPGLEENFLPHSRSQESPKELDEERRLFYVGVTRAKRYLYISCARNRRFRGQSLPQDPSRFLTEIPRDLIKGLEAIEISYRKSMEEPLSISWGSKKKKRVEDDWDIADTEEMPSDAEPIVTRIGSRKKKEKTQVKSEFKVGNTIKHPTFGEGKIIKINPAGGDDNFITIRFEKGVGIKMLSEQKAPLEKI